MRDVEVEFLDEYKRFDNLLKQKFNSDKGVSEYIDRMIKVDYSASRTIPGWNSFLNDLKHIRWIRNNITHEDYSECEEEDIEIVLEFYDMVMNLKDPLTLWAIRKKEENKNKKESCIISETTLYQPTKTKLTDNSYFPLILVVGIIILFVLLIRLFF